MILLQHLTKKTNFRILSAVPRHLSSGSPGGAVPYENVIKNTPVAFQEVPESADAVIIGGGSIGCNTLYHFTKLGFTNVVLLERDRLTSGTTWHTAGLVWSLRPSDVDVQLLAHTRELLQNLEQETGVNPGWINNGGLFIASTKERLDEYKRLHSLGKAFGIESHVLDPTETKKLYPLMNTNDVYGTLYSPRDGTVDPAGFCTALTRAATRAGARVIENCPVTAIDSELSAYGYRQVTGVRTEKGTIKTNCVVNCTGAWAPAIGDLAGVSVPLIATKHAYVVTERIEGIQGMPNVRDHDSSIYLKLQGDALCVGGYENDPPIIDKVASDAVFSLYELDWDVFGVHIQGAINRVPVLERTGIKSTVCGPESFTADHKPLMGEEPTLRGFFHGCGFNSAGMMFGGGCGQQLALWVVKGRPELDMYAYDIRRFSPKLTKHKEWIKQRSHEAYAKNYSIVYPHDEPLASRNMRLDPLHSLLLEQGCVFQERQGWERPGWFSKEGPAPVPPYDWYGAYGHPTNGITAYHQRLADGCTFGFPPNHDSIKSECNSCRKDAAIFNMSYFGNFYVTGPDAQAAADWIFSNDVSKAAGSVVYTCMLNERAGVEADLTVSVLDETSTGHWEPQFQGLGFYVAAGGGSAFQSYSHILKVIQDKKFNVDLVDLSNDVALLSVQGPKSRAILEAVSPGTDFSNERFPFSTHRLVNVSGHQCRAMRVSFVGELGWELHVPFSSAVAVYEAVMEAGKPHGLVNAGYRAMDSLSIEKGYKHWHMDLRLDDDPLEAGLSFTCKLKTAVDFNGRKALEAKKKAGMKKRLACFTIHDHVPLWGLETIWRNGEAVGYLRRADYAFTLGKSIGYGYVSDPSAESVTPDFIRSGEYHIESMGKKYKAKIHLKSPFDPENKRVKGFYD
nr:EOG090X014D [Eulimnadia texana]